MNIAVIGSRGFVDFELIKGMLERYPADEYVSGGAAGADSLVERYGREKGIPVKVFLPLFMTDKSVNYHPKYYAIRNRQIVDHADMVIAFWDGASRGTAQTLRYAEKTGKNVVVVRTNTKKEICEDDQNK